MPRVDVRTIRREQILDVAERLMGERGWAGVTFATICREGDVSNGVLTYHFKDKDDLLFALFQRTIERKRAEWLGPCAPSERPLREQVAAMVEEEVHQEAKDREFQLLAFHFLSLATERPDIAERLRAEFRAMVAEVARGFEPAAAAGHICRRPEVAAATVMSALIGFGLVYDAIGPGTAPEDVADMVYGYLTRCSGGTVPPEDAGPS